MMENITTYFVKGVSRHYEPTENYRSILQFPSPQRFSVFQLIEQFYCFDSLSFNLISRCSRQLQSFW